MGVYIPLVLRSQVREQFANCCAYCQTAEQLTVVTFEVEHIVPIIAGGKTTIENLCLSCPSCNRYKATRQTGVDSETNDVVPLFHPQLERWTDHFRWHNDGIEIVGLTAKGRVTIEALRMNRPQLVRVRRMWVKLGEHPPRFAGA